MLFGFFLVMLSNLLPFHAKQPPKQNYLAANTVCTKIVSINALDGVLYKPDNAHGKRNFTLIVQNVVERPGKRSLKVYDSKRRQISSIGLWGTGFPYGARYYSKAPGGRGQTAKQLSSAARRSGSPRILIEGKGGKCIAIDNALEEQGSIYT